MYDRNKVEEYLEKYENLIEDDRLSELFNLDNYCKEYGVKFGAELAEYCKDLLEVNYDELFSIIKKIPAYMFSGHVFTDPTYKIPEGVEVIEEGAFQHSTLSYVICPSSLKDIFYHAFNQCNLDEIKLNDGLKYIDGDAFCDCPYLSAVDIPDSVTHCDSAAFSGCTNLVLTVPKHLEKVFERSSEEFKYFEARR